MEIFGIMKWHDYMHNMLLFGKNYCGICGLIAEVLAESHREAPKKFCGECQDAMDGDLLNPTD